MLPHAVRSQRRNAVIDSLGREVPITVAERIVCLVPSETESVARMGGIERLVGRTDYCIEPALEIARVPCVGGTKNVDVDAVRDLRPDLVLANQEENTKRDVESLVRSGLRVHVSFPRTLAQSADHLASLAVLLGLDRDREPHVRAALDELLRLRSARPSPVVRVWCPVWKGPWMSFDERTYASDVLAHAGLENVMAGRPRRYPLAADLGEAKPVHVAGERDTRYPRMQLDEALGRTPDVALLPDEPYRFGRLDAEEIEGASGGRTRAIFADGKDLFWYGVRAIGAPDRLRRTIFAESLAQGT
jgi:hypothetical protein